MTLKIPRPTKEFCASVPAETAQELVDQKKQEVIQTINGIYTKQIYRMQKSVEVYDDLCNLFPRDFSRIDCVRSGKLLSIETINDLLWETIQPMLPEPKARKKQLRR
jgi:thymidylate kinase